MKDRRIRDPSALTDVRDDKIVVRCGIWVSSSVGRGGSNHRYTQIYIDDLLGRFVNPPWATLTEQRATAGRPYRRWFIFVVRLQAAA
jgi:hypothetical protein